ncbi:hypothetical protein FKM82_018518 [Ascaphus truei]
MTLRDRYWDPCFLTCLLMTLRLASRAKSPSLLMTSWCKEVQSEQDVISLQKDLERLETWAGKWQMRFNTNTCKVMHLESKINRFLSN